MAVGLSGRIEHWERHYEIPITTLRITTLLIPDDVYNFDATMPNERDSLPQAFANGQHSSS